MLVFAEIIKRPHLANADKRLVVVEAVLKMIQKMMRVCVNQTTGGLAALM